MTTLDEVFGPTGLLAQKFVGYAPRESQVKLTKACEDKFRTGGVLLADAPVGTGKSLAYLVPAILEVVKNKGKVVIVTSNIALQEQLVKKDLPMLQELLPEKFSFGIAKGFSNYVCKAAIDQADADRMMNKRACYLPEDQALLEQVLHHEWVEGDLTEFPVELPHSVKKLVVIQSEDCLGKKCQHFTDCYPKQAKKRFADAQVIVTNYHMYAIELALKLGGADKGILPEHRLVVFDEAHQFSNLARSYFGDSLTIGSLINLSAELDASGSRAEKFGIPKAINPKLKAEIKREAEAFFAELAELKRDKKRYQARLNRPQQIDGENLAKLLDEASKILSQYAEGLLEDGRKFLGNRADKLAKKAALLRGARELNRKGWIYYLDGNDRIELKSEPLSVADFLKQAIWNRDSNPRAKVLCSATLATGTGNDGFNFVSEQLGLDDTVQNVDEIIVDSPFNYSRCVLVVPKEMKDPSGEYRKQFPRDVAYNLASLATQVGGRTMGLFTSYENLRTARDYLKNNTDMRILEQGTIPRTTIIRMMKEQPENTVLLGTESFFEGVDIPGTALSAVLIDKLPFKHVEDPVLDAIKAQNPKDQWGWFNSHYVPEALVKFRQGFGRLIRSVSDYGVIVCCDVRLVSKSYGARFRKALPKETRFSDQLAMVGNYLQMMEQGETLKLKGVREARG
jgi:ATP-dependent DNA helicase DinG